MTVNTNTWNRIRYTLYRPFYDIIATFFHTFRKQSIESLELKPTDKVLILGAGTGLDLEFLNDQEQIYAIDITPAMIEEVTKKASKLDLTINALVMDGSNLDFEDDFFDAVILHLIVAVIPNPIACLQETERVLKPGGRFSILDKFITSGTKPGFLRTLINPLANFFATNINRNIDEILAHTSLTKTSDNKLHSIFRLITGYKSSEA
ncbi:MAG: class I SAM-dependent methyltransferase [Balneolaceae bacterium]